MSIPNTDKTHGKTKHLWTVSAPLQLWLTFIPLSALKPMNVKSQRGVCRIYGDTSFNKALMAGYPQTKRLKNKGTAIAGVITCPPSFLCTCKTKCLHLTKWFLALSPHHFWRSIPLIIPYLGNVSWISTSKGPKHRGTSTCIFVHNGPLWVQNDQPGSLGDTMCREELHDDFLRTKNPPKPGKENTEKVPIYMGQESTRIRAISVWKHILFYGDGCKSRDLENGKMFAMQKTGQSKRLMMIHVIQMCWR